jgi:lincosamide nucleotidyltransferase A/C/D/E
MDGDQVLDVLGRLQAAGCRPGSAAAGGSTPSSASRAEAHDDLDLAIDTRYQTQAIAALEPAGYRVVADHRPTRFVMRTGDGSTVDLHPVDFTHPGPGVQLVPGGDPFRYPADGFTHGRIAGRTVPCLTAAQQLRFHLGYPPTDKDRHDMRLLRGRLGLAVPPPY